LFFRPSCGAPFAATVPARACHFFDQQTGALISGVAA
jgi:hypothetical protein